MDQSLYFKGTQSMDVGHFYFINDQYYIDFPDPYLMKNKETISGVMHGRPCFFSFWDINKKIYWVIPISSKISKYKKIYQNKIKKYSICDTIVFGDVLGKQKAFLIQNMCPITSKYVSSEYIDPKAKIPVQLNGALEKDLIRSSRRVLALIRKGNNLVFPNVLKIEAELLKQANV